MNGSPAMSFPPSRSPEGLLATGDKTSSKDPKMGCVCLWLEKRGPVDAPGRIALQDPNVGRVAYVLQSFAAFSQVC